MTLGNVGKLPVGQFDGSRKLLLVPLITAGNDDAELLLLLKQYWGDIVEQIHRLEASIGSVGHVFHEGCVQKGEGALTYLEQANSPAAPLIRELWLRQSIIHDLEEEQLFLENLDLQRILMVGMITTIVGQKIFDWYTDARERRFSSMSKRIDESIGENETGLLVIGQDHQIQFAQDMQIVYVSPPSLNTVQQKIRDRAAAASKTQESQPDGEPENDEQG
jgi:hypothetical protein